jgi:hypothetical protein
MNLKKPAPAPSVPTELPASSSASVNAAQKDFTLDPRLGIAASVVALISLGIQVWTMLG